VLGAALLAARALADPERVAAAALTAARGAYWRGEYAGAEAVLASAPDVETAPVRRRLLASRLAVGLGDLNRAMSLVTQVSADTASGDAATRAAVAWVTTFVHLAAGDVNAAERDLTEVIALARTAGDLQRVTRARLLGAEVERGRGRPAVALAHLQRLARLVKTAPPIVRARWDLARALSAPDRVARDVVAKHVQGTGLGALALYVATGPCAESVSGAGLGPLPCSTADPFVDELVAILRVCQTAADEIELLKNVCARVRQHLHAAAAACVAVRDERPLVITGDGMRLEPAIAVRAVTAGITIAPHRLDDRIEASAPIEYGGERIGALCARWTIGSTYDTSRAASVLTMSAAAVAPMLAAVIARQSHADAGPGELLGVTPAMAALRQSVARAAAAPFAVLIDGESGSGKELVARAIHRGSGRRQKPFCTLNCAALPDDLVEAELFGHARGAFTGAIADRAGVFEEAHGGTLFLDEIGELTPRAQAKVLRVIQEGELRRVGENVSRRVDVRIVSATNRALRQEVEAGRFRLDLLYRLDVVHITVPPLRERREDVAVLAEHLWRDATQRVGSRATLGTAAMAALTRYDWPGNVRELQNVLAALAVRTPRRGVVPASALPSCFGEGAPGEQWSLDEARRTFEHRFVRAALVRTGGHRGRAAAELGVTRQGLAKLMKRLAIQN
jgi:DNA-binding NtrC family response regulator